MGNTQYRRPCLLEYEALPSTPEAAFFREVDPLRTLQPAKQIAAITFASGENGLTICSASDGRWPDGRPHDAW